MPIELIESLELWRELGAGSWTAVDHVELDGTHTVVAARRADARAVALLTAREREVTIRVAAGDSNKAIAFDLGVTSATVAEHLRRSMRKLGLHSRADLIAASAEHQDGIIVAEAGDTGDDAFALARVVDDKR